MGDRVAVLKDGVLQQCGTPRELYDHPNNVFVAGFIGSPAMNLLQAPSTDGGVKLGNTVAPISREALAQAGGTVTVGVRPEDLVRNERGEGLPVDIDVVEELGADAYIYGHTSTPDGDVPIVARVDGRDVPEKGAKIYFTHNSARMHLFNNETGQRIEA